MGRQQDARADVENHRVSPQNPTPGFGHPPRRESARGSRALHRSAELGSAGLSVTRSGAVRVTKSIAIQTALFKKKPPDNQMPTLVANLQQRTDWRSLLKIARFVFLTTGLFTFELSGLIFVLEGLA